MKETYTVLWRGSLGSSTERLIARNVKEELPTPQAGYHLTTIKVEPEELGDYADVEAIAESFPIELIQPLAAGDDLGDAGWGLRATGVESCGYSGTGVVAAVLDTGIDVKHDAFAGMDLVCEDFSGSGIADANGHGTHCAGTFFGRDVNGVRIGVARGVERALIGKVLDDTGNGTSDKIFEGLQWAINERADIISMSVGLDFPGLVRKRVDGGLPADLATSLALEGYRRNLDMFNNLMAMARRRFDGSAGPLVVAAAGNGSRRNVNASYRIGASLPAAVTNISVAAVAPYGDKFAVAPFSNANATLSGPGVGIVSAKTGGGLVAFSGTSMACPHVAGVAALWFEACKADGPVDADTVRSHLLATATRDRLGPRYNAADFGNGLVRAP